MSKRTVKKAKPTSKKTAKPSKVTLDVFPTGICGCGQREAENAELFKLIKSVKKDFSETVDINLAEYGTKIDAAVVRLNAILEASGKKRLANMGLGAQVFRSVIPLIALNGKIAFLSEVPKKEELYAKINSALRKPAKK
jgi:hypothetical protein